VTARISAPAGVDRWTREAPLSGMSRSSRVETWRRVGQDGDVRNYPIEIKIGKPFDVIAIKGADFDGTRRYAKFLAETAGGLYGSSCEIVKDCPACGLDTASAMEAFRIFGVPYHRCEACGHGFVRKRPSQQTLQGLFTDSAEHSEIYVDRAAAEQRLAQIVGPKLDWVLDVYMRTLGRGPSRAIDVGAGGGHFVAGLAKAHIAAEGWELSATSRAFAKEAFGIILHGDDFVAAPPEPASLITFWGLLEYVPEPMLLLQAARNRLSRDSGLLVVEVPRFDALSTVVQSCNPGNVARHMDPTSHINCFSDTSLMTALVRSGFEPVAAWYFGMDVYELLVHVALRCGRDDVLQRCADMIPTLQASIDAGMQCDDLIVAARPGAKG
jgi:hypothetical protein